MSASGQNGRFFRFDKYELHPHERMLEGGGKLIHLTPRVLDALILLVENEGHIVQKDALIEKLWPNSFVEENNLSQAISALRKALGIQSNGNDFIETVPKVGYRFIAPITVHDVAEDVASSTAIHANNLTLRVVRVAILLILVASAAVLGWRTIMRNPVEENSVVSEKRVKRLTNSPENEQVAGWTSDGRILITRWTNSNTPETFVIDEEGRTMAKAVNFNDIRQAIFSPDGTRMLCWRYSDNGAGTFLAAADGSGMQKLPFSPENAVWSPDSASIAFQANSIAAKKLTSTEVLIFSVKDSKLFELTTNVNFDGDPGWSPDGKRLVFVSDRDGNYEIYSILADGTDIRRLTNNPGHDSFPKFSPDGTQISFNSNIDRETTDIYLMGANGGEPLRLTDSKGNELSRNGWSPDGTKLAFNSDIDGNDEIYVMDVEPFKPAVLIEAPNADLQTPAFSPDGQKVVYTAEFLDKHSELRVFDLNTKSSTLLLNTSSPQNYPRWSPDGNWIAFHQEVNGKWDVFKVRPDGQGLTNLSDNPASDSIPTWSSDSQTIFFRSNRNGDTENSELFKMDADGTSQELLPVRKGKLGWGSIAPSGNEIVFAADRENDLSRQFDIYSFDRQSGKERLVTSRVKNDVQPIFSNDGSKIVFTSSSDGNQEIYVVNTDGTEPLRLTRNVAIDTNPSFSFDGKRVLFSSNRGGRFAIFEFGLP